MEFKKLNPIPKTELHYINSKVARAATEAQTGTSMPWYETIFHTREKIDPVGKNFSPARTLN